MSSSGGSPTRLRLTVDSVNRLKPDVVLLAGDYLAEGIVGAKYYPAATSIRPLTRLRAPLGKYAVLGNHDYPEAAAVTSALVAGASEFSTTEQFVLGLSRSSASVTNSRTMLVSPAL